jgi:nitronate monooxygenase
MKLPQIIQGGMGVGISNWRLANAVSRQGQLGVVSGTALDQMLMRRLQDGDPGGHMRRGLDAFPIRGMAERVWQKYYIQGGKPELQPYATLPVHILDSPRELLELCIVANFVEVYLAREGHTNPVGINYLEKIQLPHLPSMYGAMLAGVAFVLMGAGIPLKVPGALDLLAQHEMATYPLHVSGSQSNDEFLIKFDPKLFLEEPMAPLLRPKFLAIISSDVLGLTLQRKANGRVDGFVVEGPTAGGHNAPPRGKLQLTPDGQPVYGERDKVDLVKLQALGLPFWLAGGYGSPDRVAEALLLGAAGVQVGTVFALCAESGMRPDFKAAMLEQIRADATEVYTDPLASPTGFPFKVVQIPASISDDNVYAARPRICDLGYLREPYKIADGQVGWRCASEPTNIFTKKGGELQETVGRKCICNALIATAGHPQIRAKKWIEQGIVTSGDDLPAVLQFLHADGTAYTAADVVTHLLSHVNAVAAV